MGWTVYRTSREGLVTQLTQNETSPNIRREVCCHKVVNNVLWSVVKLTAMTSAQSLNLQPGESRAYIYCDLLEKFPEGWGHKPMAEVDHPYFYNCPKSYLKLAPVASSEWREGVAAFHTTRRQPTAHI